MQSNIDYGCFNETNIANKLVCFGVDGIVVFKNVKFVITILLIYEHAPFVNGVHYMVQCINLVVQALNSFKFGNQDQILTMYEVNLLTTLISIILRLVSLLNLIYKS